VAERPVAVEILHSSPTPQSAWAIHEPESIASARRAASSVSAKAVRASAPEKERMARWNFTIAISA
jgi:hypothetical protein